MRLSKNAKAAPGVGSRSGLNAKKRLANATMDGCYRVVATPTSAPTTNASVRAETRALIRQVRAAHHATAFQMPKRDASVHEAGHALIFALDGVSVRTIRILPRRIDGVLCWGGKVLTDGNGWRVDSSTEPAADLRQAQFILAGLAAETFLHDGKPRQGSSLDELAMARAICRTAARKLGRGSKAVYDEQVGELVSTLAKHWPVLTAIADELERTRVIHRARALKLLAPVWEAAQ